MTENNTIPDLPPEFNLIVPLREDVPQRIYPDDSLPPVLREMVMGISTEYKIQTLITSASYFLIQKRHLSYDKCLNFRVSYLLVTC